MAPKIPCPNLWNCEQSRNYSHDSIMLYNMIKSKKDRLFIDYSNHESFKSWVFWVLFQKRKSNSKHKKELTHHCWLEDRRGQLAQKVLVISRSSEQLSTIASKEWRPRACIFKEPENKLGSNTFFELAEENSTTQCLDLSLVIPWAETTDRPHQTSILPIKLNQ